VLNGGANVVTGLDISTGTIQRASITGNVITGTRNGSTIFTYDLNANFVADGSLIWNDGNPGMGFWDRSLSSGANRNTMGWSKFTANTP
jgi:nitrous oxidase accessory protein NosD